MTTFIQDLQAVKMEKYARNLIGVKDYPGITYASVYVILLDTPAPVANGPMSDNSAVAEYPGRPTTF